MEKLKMHSPNLIEENIAKLAELFPNCVTESRDDEGNVKQDIDFDQLKQELSDHVVDGLRERYHLNWPGKREALRAANTPIAKTLRPCREESVDFDNTKNLFIEGDNLDALKLLQETYLGKVKMIYIDPPYNTGNDFIYKDNFTADKEEYDLESGQRDEEGGRLVANQESNGRFHSDWLSMMYPRLKLARNLLHDKGVIFISIDDHEVDNLRNMCSELFGNHNFISQIVWKKKTGAGSSISHIFDEHEYVLAYGRSKELMPNWRILDEDDGNFQNPDNDERGPWESCAFTAPSKNKNPNQLFMIEVNFEGSGDVTSLKDGEGRTTFECFKYGNMTIFLRDVLDSDDVSYTFISEDRKIAKFVRRWAYAKQNIKEIFNQRKVYFKNGNVPRFKKFQSEYEGKALRSIYFNEFSTQQGTSALRELFGVSYLEYPKPVGLLKHLIRGVTGADDIILDFFSGSCTIAQSIFEQSANDGLHRTCIMVQFPELVDEDSEAFQAGYKTVSEIGKERVRRAGKKIKEENADKEGIENLDIGLRVLKIDTSNMEDVYYTPDQVKQDAMEGLVDNIKEDRTPEDLLFQVLLDWGVDLSLPIKEETLAGKTVFFVDGNALAACFDPDISEELVTELAKRRDLDMPLRKVVFRDAGYSSDSVKINVEQIFKLHSPDTEIKSI